MKREDALGILAENGPALCREFHAKSLSIFGSVARDEAADGSDVDVLVDYEEGHPKGLFAFFGLAIRLEELFGCEVDLAIRDSLRKEFRERILKEAVHAA